MPQRAPTPKDLALPRPTGPCARGRRPSCAALPGPHTATTPPQRTPCWLRERRGSAWRAGYSVTIGEGRFLDGFWPPRPLQLLAKSSYVQPCTRPLCLLEPCASIEHALRSSPVATATSAAGWMRPAAVDGGYRSVALIITLNDTNYHVQNTQKTYN